MASKNINGLEEGFYLLWLNLLRKFKHAEMSFRNSVT